MTSVHSDLFSVTRMCLLADHQDSQRNDRSVDYRIMPLCAITHSCGINNHKHKGKVLKKEYNNKKIKTMDKKESFGQKFLSGFGLCYSPQNKIKSLKIKQINIILVQQQ